MEGATPDPFTQYNALKIKLQCVAPKIKAIVEQGRSIANDRTQLFLYKGMYKELKPFFHSFNETWDQLVELLAAGKTPSEFPTNDDKSLIKAVERYYYEGCAIYEEYMNPTPTQAASGSTSNIQNSTLSDSRIVRGRLPQINLPTFGGNPADWPLFRDTFRSLIHEETSISNIEKFHFLISSLQGPARSLIKGIKVEEANYVQAWNLLMQTYEDSRRLASNYLRVAVDFVPFKGRPSANGLKLLLSSVGESIESFKLLDISDKTDYLLFFLLFRCLDPATRRDFERQYSTTKFPTYQNLLDFIRTEWRSLDLSQEETNHTSVRPNPNSGGRNQLSYSKGNRSQASLLASNPLSRVPSNAKTFPSNKDTRAPGLSCPVCKVSHTLYQCTQFKRAIPTERVKLLHNWQGCTNCLSAKHCKDKCTSQRRCQICSQNHHSWLHVPSGVVSINQPVTQPSLQGSLTLGSLCHQGDVLLGTAMIEIQDHRGIYRKIRAVTDSGSQHSFITEECSKTLGLTIQPCKQHIMGIGQAPLQGMTGKVNLRIRSSIASATRGDFSVEGIVVSRITGNLPHSSIPPATQDLYKSYVLADEEFWKPGPVEFLLGGDLFYDVITGRPVTVTPEAPRLLPTIFGYVLGGPLKTSSVPHSSSTLLVRDEEDITKVMSKFWELEEVSKVPIVSKEDTVCESHFMATHRRLSTGRYVVSLPFKDSIHALVNPWQQALSRLSNLEHKLAKNVSLRKGYNEFIQEYLSLGHMRLVPSGTSAYTIPHHAVVKVHNNQTKLRVVFDASCSTGVGSLNDHMYAGPKLQLSICDIITNFRLHQLVFTADIVKMYRQILVDPSDRQFQHILWRFDPAECVKEYELCTVTYGEKASPYLAQRCIRQLVHDEGTPFPHASRVLLEDIYVDDIVTGATTVEQLLQLKEELIMLLGKGEFQLSKWSSNCSELLDTLKEGELGNTCINLAEDDARVKVLGIQWHPREDVFSYAICTPQYTPTKRAILSSIARIYDPLGFLSPVIFYAKTVLQEMWLAKVGWDEVGPPSTSEKWKFFLQHLDQLSKVKLPRRIISDRATHYNIVGFSDASQHGYSAVIYLQVVTPEGCHASLLTAKTKLAPVKPMSIPRLELSGALLLCRLVVSCKGLVSKMSINAKHFFTDSQVVLGWLSTPPELLNTFVAHRVVEVMEHTHRSQWNYVPSRENPADCSSRGLLPSELPHHHLWWNGPKWLSTPPDCWSSWVPNSKQDLPELKRQHTTTLTVIESPTLIEWMERFSSFNKLIRSMAYVQRFLKGTRRQETRSGPISVAEFRNANKLCIKLTQSNYLSEGEINQAKLTKSKALRALRPFLDEEGLVRVGGRIQNSSVPFDAKHPYIIPKSSHYAILLVDHYHHSYMHLGPTALQAMLQSKYWIISARKLIRRRVHNCIRCYKATRPPQIPVMGNLPLCRLQEGQVFSQIGIDLGGPFYIRESLRRKASLGKAYLCLFICMCTKAVHLEVVSSCSTEAFLAAFERFVARRGKPSHVYSDCGTNFIGAANRIKELLTVLKSKATQEKLLQWATPKEISWSFNPPAAPHFGGLWEAGIKAAKTLLQRTVGENTLTFEELSTLFCRVEGILNSRPIVPLSNDPESVDALTPGHFLIGRPITALPEQEISNDTNVVQRWDLIKQRAQRFWTRWRMEYLHQLQQRKRWMKDHENLRENDLVILVEPNAPQRVWPMARILRTHPGQDGVVRVVTIKTSSGTYKRPVSKVVPLIPINHPDDN